MTSPFDYSHKITVRSRSTAYPPTYNTTCGLGGALATDDDYQVIGIRSEQGRVWRVAESPTCPTCRESTH
jgi:hypothetical protein